MECFTHPGSSAVGTCKSCNRAVCRTCARDLTFAIVCSDACASEANELHEMNQRAKKIYGLGTAKRNAPLVSIMWLAFAILFGGFGIYPLFTRGHVEWFLVLFGLLSAVMAVVSYRRARELQLNC